MAGLHCNGLSAITRRFLFVKLGFSFGQSPKKQKSECGELSPCFLQQLLWSILASVVASAP